MSYVRYCGVYSITSEKTGDLYIGSAADIKGRWSLHKHQLKKHTHGNRFLQKAHDDFGIDTLKLRILEECPPDQRLAREQFYLDALKPALNISKVAGSSLGVKRTEATRAKIAAAKTGVKYLPRSDESRRRYSESKTGAKHPLFNKEHSEEHKLRISAGLKRAYLEGRRSRK